MSVQTYPVGLLVDDNNIILTAPVVAVSTVETKSGATVSGGVAGVTVNNSGTAKPISVDYDADTLGEAWITLSVSQAGKPTTSTNATVAVFASRDSSRIAAIPVPPSATVAGTPTVTTVAVTGLALTTNNAYRNAYAWFTSGALSYAAPFPVTSSTYSSGTTTLTFASPGLPVAPTAGDKVTIVGSKN